MRSDRVGEIRAVDLDREAQPGPGEDHGTHDQVVGERRLGFSRCRDDVVHRRHVRVQVPVELGVGQVGERLHLEALVAVEHVHGQQAADLRPVGRDAARVTGLADLPDAKLAALPVAHGVDPVLLGNRAVLTKQMNLMTLPRERLGEARVVDVAAGAVKQITVKDQDSHGSTVLAVAAVAPRVAKPRHALLAIATAPPANRVMVPAVQNPEQTYRLRAPASGREALAKVEAATASMSTARRVRRCTSWRRPCPSPPRSPLW